MNHHPFNLWLCPASFWSSSPQTCMCQCGLKREVACARLVDLTRQLSHTSALKLSLEGSLQVLSGFSLCTFVKEATNLTCQNTYDDTL